MNVEGISTATNGATNITRVTRANSTTLVANKTNAGKSIVSIEVNMEAYESQCGVNQAAAAKKKRLALGNISNAEGVQQSTVVSGAAAAAPPAVKDAKKYRFGGANIVNIASFGLAQKKSDTQALLPKKSSSISFICVQT